MIAASRQIVFKDRRDAGRRLAELVQGIPLESPLVVGLMPGGVPVAFEIARRLGTPLDISLSRRLRVPGPVSVEVGTVEAGDVVIFDREALAEADPTPTLLESVIAYERGVLRELRRLYRHGGPLDVSGSDVVLVDDGVTSGEKVISAARAMRSNGASRVILAVPILPAGSHHRLVPAFDEIVFIDSPIRFGGVSVWYEEFEEVGDGEVIALLSASRENRQVGPQLPGREPAVGRQSAVAI